jgi:peroxisomal membrane protein 4
MEVCLCDHDNCIISAFRGLRNGLYYGGKIRFVHSLVMTLLFKNGTLYEKLKNVIQPTLEHAISLGLFAFIYKITACILKQLFKTKNKIVYFLAGLVGSYFMWTKRSPVNMQIMLYLLSRNIMAIANIISEKYFPNFKGFEITSMIVWGVVMFLFEYKPKALQSSLESSMKFIYKESDGYNTWRDLIPFYIPF